MGFELTRFIGEIDNEFICSICTPVVENPMQSTCEHVFCSQCINVWLEQAKTCPVGRTLLVLENVKPVARYFRNILAKLEIKCDFGKSNTKSNKFVYIHNSKFCYFLYRMERMPKCS